MMLHPVIRPIALYCAMMFAISGFGNHAAYAEPNPDWIVTELSGQVFSKQAESALAPVASGDRLPIGSLIETRADGRAILSRGSSSMTVSPSSTIELTRDGNGSTRTSIFQKIGTVLYKVEKQAEEHFEVETPYLAALVKGTSFAVGVNDGTATTHVVEGAVEVTSLGSGQVQMVRPGQTATVSTANGLQLQMSHHSGGATRSDATGRANTAVAQSGEQHRKNQVINRTLGVTHIDIAKVTDALVSAGRGDGVTSATATDYDVIGTSGSGGALGTGVDVGTSATAASATGGPGSVSVGGVSVGTSVGGVSIGTPVGGVSVSVPGPVELPLDTSSIPAISP